MVRNGAAQSEIYTGAAEMTAKILEGARPSELPLRQATRFDLAIDNRTAKALGLTIPPSLPLQADEVIEQGFAPTSGFRRIGGTREFTP